MTQLLNLEVNALILVFLRFGAAFMLIPGLMSSYVNARLRLCIALAITVVATPLVSDKIAMPTGAIDETIRFCLFEICYGLFLGLMMQIMFQAINLAGNLAGQATGFSNAQVFDPNFQTQSIVIESFLSLVAIVFIFVTDLHHLMFGAVIESYRVFPFGGNLPTGDMAKFLTKSLNESFSIGFKIGSPFVAFTLIFYSGMGLISRLMPQLNIFFLSLPLQIYLGLGVLFLTLPIMILWFTKYFESELYHLSN